MNKVRRKRLSEALELISQATDSDQALTYTEPKK